MSEFPVQDYSRLGFSQKRRLPKTAYFHDGRRVIDFVLAYEPDAGGKNREEWSNMRSQFEAELVRRGLELEYEAKELSEDKKTAFIKIHTPWEALAMQAELEKVQ